MANTFNISVAPEIAALEAKVDLIDAMANLIIFTDFPATNTKIDDNKAVVDAIKLKTDATPQHVRGKFYMGRLSTSSATFVEVINLTGRGILKHVVIKLGDAADTIEVRITLDGTAFDTRTHTGNVTNMNVVPTAVTPEAATIMLWFDTYDGDDIALFNMEFQATCLVEIRRSAGSAAEVHCKCFYILDQF